MYLHIALFTIKFQDSSALKLFQKGSFMNAPKWTIAEIIELILAGNQTLWAIIFLLPGNVFDRGDYQLKAIYAQDWLWGIFLFVISSLFIFGPQNRQLGYRRYLHFFSWVFWLGIIVLLSSRLLANGIRETDILLISPYLVVALLHVALYARLSGVKWNL